MAETQCAFSNVRSLLPAEQDGDAGWKSLKISIENLLEYRWPDDETGEHYLVEEQLVVFLDNGALFQKTCKDLARRHMSPQELTHLQKQSSLPTLSCDTVVVKTDDACQAMAQHFPQKYKDYLALVHQREQKRIAFLQEDSLKHRKLAANVKKAMRDAAAFNTHFNQERKEERLAYFDMQTQIIQVPRASKMRPARSPNKATQYPVAVIPGQFQEHYKRYTPKELNCLPLGTVLNCAPLLPPEEMSLKRQQFFNSLARQDTGSPGSSSSSDSNDDASETQDTNVDYDSRSVSGVADQDDTASKPHKRLKKNDAFCGICLKGAEKNKKGVAEELIHCSQCENSGHPSCLNMTRHLVAMVATYAWQCMECKACTLCNNPHDEDQMMFCDHCDRGYHSYCVGLRGIPLGRWVCENCGKCSSCLAKDPGRSTRWQEEFTKPRDGSRVSYLQIHCEACSRLFKEGNFCPVCLKVYRNEESDLLMVCCDACDRWIHTDCDGIDDTRYDELAMDTSVPYKCILCRGEQDERMDFYHKKYRV